jgi:ABC-type multidrug transport system fused ATPase/permease subunit
MDKFQEDLVTGSRKVKEAPVQINGELAFVQQTPWIQSMTIRENILYGLPLDKERYVDTIRICELE